ncbi:MAG: peptidoglycan DD-metalloendopeptidase family protein [Clostridia bacterium]|nr:peptidoglycan DD-metalloendopeptidase family protein [Clostridia bacterium]
MDTVYRISYYAGVQTVRLMHRLGRFFTLLFLPLRLLLKRVATTVRKHRGRTLRAKLHTFTQYCFEAVQRVRAAWQKKPLLGILQVLLLLIAAVRRYRHIVKGAVMVVAIVATAWLLQETFRYWNSITFALALTDAEGETFGYVSDEAQLQAGIAMAEERLEMTGVTLEADVKPDVSLHMIPQANILDKTEICDYLLSHTNTALSYACGIYIDGAFHGAVIGHGNAERLLEDILVDSRKGQEGVTASFFETVELIDGRYPEERIMTPQDMTEQLVSEAVAQEYYELKGAETLTEISQKTGVEETVLRELNPGVGYTVPGGQTLLIRRGEPHLQVLVSGTIQYEVDVPYAVKRVADASSYEGVERVRTNGENGRSRITATVTYLDGQQLSSVITASTVIREPVTQVVAYGTKKIDKHYQGGANATGHFIWPVPETRYVSQYYKSGVHNAIDIWSRDMTGQDIVAVDGGTVIVAEDPSGTSYWSYGKYIIIDHGGGYQTLYAHCHELFVKEGDKVLQGQRIASVGNTGRSTAPHLHFEVRVNGRAVNPMKFY